jgi:hypothetical protein
VGALWLARSDPAGGSKAHVVAKTPAVIRVTTPLELHLDVGDSCCISAMNLRLR